MVDGASIWEVGDVGPRFGGARGEDKVGNVGDVGDAGPRFAGLDKVGDDKLLFLFGVGVAHATL